MPDFALRGIDEVLAERIKAHAREHGLTLNEAILDLLRRATGLATSTDANGNAPLQDVAHLGGMWSAEEMQAMRQAIRAFENLK